MQDKNATLLDRTPCLLLGSQPTKNRLKASPFRQLTRTFVERSSTTPDDPSQSSPDTCRRTYLICSGFFLLVKLQIMW